MRDENLRVTRLIARLCVVAAAAFTATIAAAQMPQGAGMPDVRQMSGVPLPSGELPRGTVTVRVVRGSLANPLTNLEVELTGGASAKASTNEAGRAEFSGLAVGATVRAVATVDGERLQSQDFAVPTSGGIRVMLVATDPALAKRDEEDRKLAAGPARPGIVVFGDQSRIVFELGDDGLTVFNIFEIQNTARVPVDPSGPVVFDLPPAAERASILEGSSPAATAAGKRVTVNGPFPPGATLVQFAYNLPYTGATVDYRQTLPASLSQVTIIAQKVEGMAVTSPHISQQREMRADGGQYLVGQGPAVPAGSDITVSFSGLPHAATWPRNLALALAVVILTSGALAAFRGRRSPAADAERRRLELERERLFAALASLETSQRTGAIDPVTYAEERRRLVVALERVYAALDDQVAA
jgi:hypothetical protein